MSDKVLLDKIAGVIVANNKVLLEAVDEKIKSSEKRLEKKILATEGKLSKKIVDSQKDTIEVLSAMIHTSYNMHEKRIRQLEEEVGISSPKS